MPVIVLDKEAVSRQTFVAIDPGAKESGYVVLTGKTVNEHGKIPNQTVIDYLLDVYAGRQVVLERPTLYGVAGDDLLQTCIWFGRFFQACPGTADWLTRGDVVRYWTGRAVLSKPKDAPEGYKQPKPDAVLKQLIIDRYGGKDVAIGKGPTKKSPGNPGPLFGVEKDAWQALALGLAYQDGARH